MHENMIGDENDLSWEEKRFLYISKENRGHFLPAIISKDRTKAHREFMKPLEDAEAVELNEENDDEDDEDEDNYSEDYDSSDSCEGGYESDFSYTEDQKQYLARVVQQNKEGWEKVLAKKPWLRK